MQNSEALIKHTLDLINKNIREINEKKIAAYTHLDRMEEKLSFIRSEDYSDEEIFRAETDWKQALEVYNNLCDEETARLADRDLFLKETAE